MSLLPEGLGNAKSELVLKFSKGFNSKLSDYTFKGYKPVEARINFIVYWKNDNNEKESKIVLPELLFRR
jgi:ATP-dependent DNA helicase RecQ